MSDVVPMDRVQTLHHRFAAARCVVLASPVHNGQVSMAWKNLIDGVSRVGSLGLARRMPPCA